MLPEASRRAQGEKKMTVNLRYLIVGALVVVVIVLAYQLYQARKQPEGVQINVGPGGVSIETK